MMHYLDHINKRYLGRRFGSGSKIVWISRHDQDVLVLYYYQCYEDWGRATELISRIAKNIKTYYNVGQVTTMYSPFDTKEKLFTYFSESSRAYNFPPIKNVHV